MTLIFNGTTITAVTYNGTALDKLIYNGVTVWERWVLRTGNLYSMTSNSSPSPFSCTNHNTILGGAVWNAFDNNASTGCTGGSNHAWEGITEISISFGSTKKPKKILLRTASNLDTTKGVRIRANSVSGTVLVVAGQKAGGF